MEHIHLDIILQTFIISVMILFVYFRLAFFSRYNSQIFIAVKLHNQQVMVNGTISVNHGRTKAVRGDSTKMVSLHLKELV